MKSGFKIYMSEQGFSFRKILLFYSTMNAHECVYAYMNIAQTLWKSFSGGFSVSSSLMSSE